MQHKWLKMIGGVAIVAFSLSACSKDDDDDIDNEEELITTVSLTFTEVGTTNTFSAVFRDTDGAGGNAPSTFDEIVLNPSKSYECSVSFLDESVTPADDITSEVQAEAEDHELFLIPATVNITINRTDVDDNSRPIGLRSTWTTGEASTGTVRVVLKHKPGNKGTNDDVSKGETDVDLNFTAKVQ